MNAMYTSISSVFLALNSGMLQPETKRRRKSVMAAGWELGRGKKNNLNVPPANRVKGI
jgi:hypothetical protein